MLEYDHDFPCAEIPHVERAICLLDELVVLRIQIPAAKHFPLVAA